MPGPKEESALACLDGLQLRLARASDVERIAALHADSWRRHYRGAYSDAFLDGDVFTDRLAVWSERLGQSGPGACTIVAEHDDALFGFAHTMFDHDSSSGALLDNLHVSNGQKRRGIGSRLLVLTAAAVIDHSATSALYLWVLEQNVNAQAFYRACGGTCVERAPVPAPGEVPGRLNGSPAGLRYVWRDPSALVGSEVASPLTR
jgi:ribosomal protein S18 acetylase RimI-like enzyme